MYAWLIFAVLYIPIQLQILSSSNKYGIGSPLTHQQEFNELINCLTFSDLPYCRAFERLTLIIDYFNHNYLMAIFLISFIIGVIILWKKNKNNLFFLILWITLFSLITFFYDEIIFIGLAERFSIALMMPFLIISGNGAYWIIDKVKKKNYKLPYSKILIILLCIFVAFFLFNYESLRFDDEKLYEGRLEREFATEMINKINRSCYVINIGSNINFFNLYMDVNFVNEDLHNINKLLIEDKCVIYYVKNDDLWSPIADTYNLTILFGKDIDVDNKIKIYKLSLKG